MGRKRSQSLPPKVLPDEFIYQEKLKTQTSCKKIVKAKSAPQRSKSSSRSISRKMPQESTQSIVLSRGNLNLCVNFPSDTLVTLKDGHAEKFILRGECQCKAIRSFLKFY